MPQIHLAAAADRNYVEVDLEPAAKVDLNQAAAKDWNCWRALDVEFVRRSSAGSLAFR